MVVTDFSLKHDAVGPETFGGLMVPANGTSSGDVLTSQGDGEPAQWAAGGGSIPDPITTAVTIAPATAADPDLTITPAGAEAIISAGVFTVATDGGVTSNGQSSFGQNGDDEPDARALEVFGFTGTGHAFYVADGAFDDLIELGPGQVAGFFGATPVGPQVVPMTTPSVQDVIDGLVALGLFVQHD